MDYAEVAPANYFVGKMGRRWLSPQGSHVVRQAVAGK